MSDKNKVDTTAAPPNAAKKKNRTLIIAGVVIVLVIAAVLLLVIQGNSTSADMNAGSFTIEQSYSGPTTFTVQVTNYGNEYGSESLVCFVNIGVDSYSNSQTVDLAAGCSTTVTIVVVTPFGTTVTKNMCGVYF